MARLELTPEPPYEESGMPEIVWLDRLADAVEQARTRQVPIFVDFVFPG